MQAKQIVGITVSLLDTKQEVEYTTEKELDDFKSKVANDLGVTVDSVKLVTRGSKKVVRNYK